jgi:hypothetical protein
MASRAPQLDEFLTAKQISGSLRDEQRQSVTRNDPLIQFVLNAPKSTEPMSPEGQRALERYLQKNTAQRA